MSTVRQAMAVGSQQMTMATKLPPSKYLKTDSIVAFNGSPQELDAFDVSIQCMLEFYNFPLYYGGTVRGDPDGEYEYVSAIDPDEVSDYVLGKRLCAGLCGRLVKSAQHWWQSYVRDNKPKPNCWRKHISVGSVPHNVVEVSLYDLLYDHFSSDMDTLKAELELERFVWKPFGEDSMDVVVFKDHVEGLLWRAGITGSSRSFQRIRTIRDCLPPMFKKLVHMLKTEPQLWDAIGVAYSTFVVDYIGRQRMRWRTSTANSKPAKVKRHQVATGNRTCHRCGKKGHMVKDCSVTAAPVSFVQKEDSTPFYGLPCITSVVNLCPTKQEVVILEKVVIPEEVVVDSVPVLTMVMSPTIQEVLAQEAVAALETVDPVDCEDRYILELALFAGGSEKITISLPEIVFGEDHGRDPFNLGIQEEVGIPVVEGEDTLHAESEAQSNDVESHDVKTHDVKTYDLESQNARVKVVLLQGLRRQHRTYELKTHGDYIADDFDRRMIKSSDGRECGRKRARKGCKRRLRGISGKRFSTPVEMAWDVTLCTATMDSEKAMLEI